MESIDTFTEKTTGSRTVNFKNTLIKLAGMREGALIILIIVISIILANLSPVFLTKENLINTIFSFSIQGIVVVGMTVALISGGFDLSVGSVVAITGVVAGQLFLSGVNIWIGAVAALIVAVSVGCLNGFLITKVGLSSFIATLSTMGIARGACFVLTRGKTLPLLSMPQQFKVIGKGMVGSIPVLVIIFLTIVIISDFLLRRGKIARLVFYVGSNEKAAVFSGINAGLVKFLVYVFVSFLAGITGILSLARFAMASPTFGTGLEMSVISAAVIGGASLNGGEGTIFGSVLGVVLLGIVTSALVLLDISVYWQQLVSSLILCIAVSFDTLNEKRKASRLTKAVRC